MVTRGGKRYTVDPDTGCWIWQPAAKSPAAPRAGPPRFVYARRTAYERNRGPVPEGMRLLPRCGDVACVNPDHMDVLTPAEVARRVRTRLTEDVVRAVLALGTDLPTAEIAARVGLDRRTVYSIQTGAQGGRFAPEVARTRTPRKNRPRADPTNAVPPNPSGLCLCGCGERTRMAPHSSCRQGWVRGHPVRYVAGHNSPKGRGLRDAEVRDVLELGATEAPGEIARRYGVAEKHIVAILRGWRRKDVAPEVPRPLIKAAGGE